MCHWILCVRALSGILGKGTVGSGVRIAGICVCGLGPIFFDERWGPGTICERFGNQHCLNYLILDCRAFWVRMRMYVSRFMFGWMCGSQLEWLLEYGVCMHGAS